MNKNGEKTKLLAVIAVFAMVACALVAFAPVADAADEPTPVLVKDDTGLVDALKDGAASIQLTANISTATEFSITEDTVIDLNGKKITNTANTNPDDVSGAVFDISNGAVVTIKNGEMVNTAGIRGNGYAIVVDGRETPGVGLTLDNVTITSNNYGVYVAGGASTENAAILTVTNSTIASLGTASAVSTNGLNGNESISITGSKLSSVGGAAVYSPANAEWTIVDTDLTGITGIDMRAGDITVTGGSITFNTSATNDSNANVSAGSGPLGLGVAISVLDANNYAKGSQISIAVDGVDMVNKKGDTNINYDVLVSAFAYTSLSGTDTVGGLFTTAGNTTSPISVSYDGIEVEYAASESATAAAIEFTTDSNNKPVVNVTAGKNSNVTFTEDASNVVLTQESGANVIVASGKSVTVSDYSGETSSRNAVVLGSGSKIALPADTTGMTFTGASNATATIGTTAQEITKKASDVSDIETLDMYLKAGLETVTYTGTEISKDITVQAGTTLTMTGIVTLDAGVTIVNNGTIIVKEHSITIKEEIIDGETVSGVFENQGGIVDLVYFKSESTGNVLVQNLSGDFTVTHGSIAFDGTITGAGEKNGVITINDEDVEISGTINGDVQIVKAGDANVNVTFGKLIINSGATLYLDDGINYSVSNTTDNKADGYVYLYGAVKPYNDAKDITIDVAKDNAFTAFNGAKLTGGILVTGAGNIDLSKAQNPQSVGEDISDDKTYGQLEDVTIIDSLTIKNDATVTIKGGFTVNEGVTLTIEEGSKLVIDSAVASMIVNGTIVVEEGAFLEVVKSKDVTVAGSIESEGSVTIGESGNIVKVVVKSGGSILIDESENSVVKINGGLTIEAGAQMTVKDDMTITSITNKGTIILDGAVLNAASTISMAADGAVVEIKSVTGAATLNVTDLGLVFADQKTTVVDGKQNTFEVTCTATDGISGITLKEVLSGSKAENYASSLDISGSVKYVDDSTEDTGTGTGIGFTVTGSKIAVSGELTLGSDVKMTVNGAMSVAGTIMAVAEDSDITGTGPITVEGLIQIVDEMSDVRVINAVMYEQDVNGETNYFYTNFADAVASGAEEIEILGKVTVTETITVPATTDVKNSGELVVGADSDAGRDVVLTIANGSEISKGIVTVNGTLYFENKKDQKANDIISDVEIIGEVDARYTNIYTALAEAQAGQTVTITADNVLLKSNLTIPEGVTLEVPNTKHLQVLEGVTVTVNGTLSAYHAVKAIDATDKVSEGLYDSKASVKVGEERAAIVVNGTFMTSEALTYDVYKIAGAYYSMIGDAGAYNYVTPLDAASKVAAQVTDGEITVNGKVAAGDVTFTGTEVAPVSVIVSAGSELTVSSITLAETELTVNGTFTGTVTVGDASIAAVKVRSMVVTSDDGLYVEKADATLMEDGVTVAKINAVAGTVIVQSVTGNMTVDTGATVTAPNTTTVKNGSIEGNLTVNGTLSVVKGTSMTVTDNVYVAGAVNVAAETDTDAPGTLVIEGTLFVGMNADFETIGAAASVAGPVDVELVYAVSGTTVSADVTDVLTEATSFDVEGSVWMTAYVAAGNTVYKIGAVDEAPVENAYFGKVWNDADGKNANDKYIGAVETVYAVVDYDVYHIVIYADQAVDDIYLNGNLMYYNPLFNAYTADVPADSYTLTYTLKNGYDGQGVLKVVDGEVTVSGMTFTAAGTPETAAGIDYEFQLTGFQKTGYVPESPDAGSDSGDSGMTITDYLLIVLVILIIVMAIIVAMRLMRS